MKQLRKNSIRLFFVVTVANFCLMAQTSPPSLFKPSKAPISFGPQSTNPIYAGIKIERSRSVQIALPLIDKNAADEAIKNAPIAFGEQDKQPLESLPSLKRLKLNLFENLTVITDLKRVSVVNDGKTVVWEGTIEGEKSGEVSLAATDSTVSGSITTDSGKIYQIRPNSTAQGESYILETDQKNFPKDKDPIPVKDLPPGAADVVPGSDDGSIIDVLVAYTTAAKNAAGGDAGMANLIQVAIRETNTGYANSGVIQRVRLVGTLEVTYNESEGFDKALERLSNTNDSTMDNIRKLRDKDGADLVSLWINNSQYCGLAYLMTQPSPAFEAKGYSVVHVGCATGYYSFGHEMGHNQGCQHDRAHADSQGAFAYSYGFAKPTGPKTFRTIMSYDCNPTCIRVNYWSNPDVKYKEMPAGVADNDAAAADNAHTLNQTRVTAAQWRKSVAGTAATQPSSSPTDKAASPK